MNREAARVEQAGRTRAEIEEEFRVFAEKLQAEAQKMREERAALAKEVEKLREDFRLTARVTWDTVMSQEMTLVTQTEQVIRGECFLI